MEDVTQETTDNTEAVAEVTEQEQTEISPELVKLQKELEMKENAIRALADEKARLVEAQKKHGAEMVRKKEREHAAQEEARIKAEEAKDYKTSLEILKKQREEQEKAMKSFEQERTNWDKQRKQMAVMLELQKPGRINSSVPVKDVLPHINLDSVELDESGVKGFDTILEQLLTGRDYLKPVNGQQAKMSGLDMATTGKSGTMLQASHEAKLLASNVPEYDIETAVELLKSPEFKEMAKANGWLKEKLTLKDIM